MMDDFTIEAPDMSWPVSEIFGPTIQGEGPLIGTLTYFIRFGGCENHCCFCDTSYANSPEALKDMPRMNSAAILEALDALGPFHPPWVTLTGGNPLIHDLEPLITALKMSRYKLAIETQGNTWKNWIRRIKSVVISPKPPSAGSFDLFAFQKFMSHFWAPGQQVVLKIPVFDQADLDFVDSVHRQYHYIPMYLSLGTRSPNSGNLEVKADTTEDLMDRYRDLLNRLRRWRSLQDVIFLPQLHVLVWGHRKGV